jgi:antirestriction protein ArdC
MCRVKILSAFPTRLPTPTRSIITARRSMNLVTGQAIRPAFICASLGIVPTVRHSDYIGNWLQVLKEDARAIVKAASLASKACDFILQFKAANKDNSDLEQAA